MLLGSGDTPADGQAKMNRSTRGQWDLYAHHRRQIERLIVPAAPGGRLCVLGAGNCNDLDLTWLAAAYAETRLVDIDPAALDRAVDRQGVKGVRRWRVETEGWRGDGPIALQAPIDLTGIADLVASWKGRLVPDSVVVQAIHTMEAVPAQPSSVTDPRGVILIGTARRQPASVDRAHTSPAPTALHAGAERNGSVRSAAPDSLLPSTHHTAQQLWPDADRACFDFVLSPCVLSQLWCSVRDVLGGGHPMWPKLKAALRRRHLRDMLGLLRPGGRGVIVCDLASSNRVKGLDRAQPDDLDALMRACIDEGGKGFKGLEPVDMGAALRAAGATDIGATPPWIWHLGPAKAFLCYALTFTRP